MTVLAIILVIEKFPGANTLEVTRGVEEALKELQPGLQGLDIDTNVYRPANYIETAVGNLGTLAIIGTHPCGAGVPRLYLPMAHGVDQPGGHPLVTDSGRDGALPDWGDLQYDDVNGDGGRPRRRR